MNGVLQLKDVVAIGQSLFRSISGVFNLTEFVADVWPAANVNHLVGDVQIQQLERCPQVEMDGCHRLAALSLFPHAWCDRLRASVLVGRHRSAKTTFAEMCGQKEAADTRI